MTIVLQDDLRDRGRCLLGMADDTGCLTEWLVAIAIVPVRVGLVSPIGTFCYRRLPPLLVLAICDIEYANVLWHKA